MKIIFNRFFLFITIFITFCSSSLWAKNNRIQNQQFNVGIAVIDSELLVKKFSNDYNLFNKIMNDYKEVMKNVTYAPNMTPEQKTQQAQDELNKIVEHYSYQIVQIITSVVNEIVKEQSLIFVTNKKTFSVKDILLAANERRIAPNTNNQVNNTIQTDAFFNQSVLSYTYGYTDITDEVSKRLKKMSSRIKILSYGRSLK